MPPRPLALLVLLLGASVDALETRSYPILSQRRLELTRQYVKQHYGLDSTRLKDPQIIVIHATEIATLEKTLKTFKPDTIDPARKDLSKASRLNVGIHFVVDRDGAILSLLPLDVIARHAVGLNHVSIGIENVGSSADLTDAQLKADVLLVKDLVAQRPTLRYLIGHHEYVDKSRPHYTLYKELDAAYAPTHKSDPGAKFMADLRAELAGQDIRLQD